MRLVAARIVMRQAREVSNHETPKPRRDSRHNRNAADDLYSTLLELNMKYLLILTIGTAIGYLTGSHSARYQRSHDLQALIDIEATKRRADGFYRRGDILTEHEPAESSAGVAREVLR